MFEYGIFICKPRPGGLVAIKHHFKMSDVFLQTMLNDPICFRLTLAKDKKVFFTFHCSSREDKQYWIAKIKKTMIEFYSSETFRRNGDNAQLRTSDTVGYGGVTASASADGVGQALQKSDKRRGGDGMQRKLSVRGNGRKRLSGSDAVQGRRRLSAMEALAKPPVPMTSLISPAAVK